MSIPRRTFIKSSSAVFAAGAVLPSSLAAAQLQRESTDNTVNHKPDRKINFRILQQQDDRTVLRNPHKGFYWHYVDNGYTWSLRVVNCEASPRMPFATPEWVKDAGAKGKWFRGGPGAGFWGPDYGDPVFLKKMDNFFKALAARYDGDPMLELIDIGSYGNWGEGHVVFSDGRVWPVEVLILLQI